MVTAEHGRLDPPAELADPVARAAARSASGIRATERVFAPTRPEQGIAELGLESQVELAPTVRARRRVVEARRRAVVLAPGRAMAAGGQAPPRRRGQRVVVGQSELVAVQESLSEVVAEDLVQLDELGAVRSSHVAKRACRSARTDFGSAS